MNNSSKMTSMKRFRWIWLVSAWICLSALGAEPEVRFGGGHPWLSRNRVVYAEEAPIKARTSSGEGEKAFRAEKPVKRVAERPIPNGRVFDITVSMYKHRTEEERKKIEEIFKYFAWGVYEATEGKHKIGTVRIYEQSGISADIIWRKSGRVEASPFDHICMFDYDMGNHDDYFSTQMNRALAGFILTHEWGHFKYGFGDEYDYSYGGKLIRPWDVSVEPSLMGVTRNVLVNGFHPEWLNLSISYDPAGGRYRNTQKTVQHRLYEQSCLEQLVHPVRPQRMFYHDADAWFLVVDVFNPSYFETINYPEFAGDINPTKDPRIDLTVEGQQSATNELKVIWPDNSKLVWAICLDHSGSMSDGDLELAKARTKHAIDQAPVGTLVGIFAFASAVNNIVPFTEVTDANRASLKSSVDSFNSGGGTTALWKAAYEALTQMEAMDPDHNNLGSLLLMTDGEDNASSPITRPMVESKCLEMNVAFNSIAYGQNVNAQVLQDIAAATGGKNVSATDSLLSVNDAFNRLLSYGSCRLTISDEAGRTSADRSWTSSFWMDSSGTDMQVTASLSVPHQDATVAFVSPSGIRYEANANTDVGSESSFVFSQTNPEPGTWTVSVTAPAGTQISCYADVAASKIPPRLRVWNDDDNNMVYASLSYVDPVDGANVRALLHENGTTRSVPFEPIGAGTYRLKLSDCGTFLDGFTVRADAEKDVATHTYIGVMDHIGDNEGEPISECFTRSEWVALGKEDAVSFHASGKGMLEFQWRTNGESVPERIDFLCNGNTNATLASKQGWTKKEFVFNEDGAHVFHWQTTNEVRKFTGTWLRNVIWHPEPDVAMGPIEVTPRWPWNGLVDIDFSFVPTLAGTKASFTVSGVDGDLGTTVEAKTLSGSYRNLDKGTYRVTWNLGADAPGFHSSAFTVHLDSSIDPFSPPNVEVAGLSASEGINLRWPGMSSAETYTVFRATNANGTDATPIGSVSIRAADGEWVRFLDSTAPNGKTVWYAVKASAWKLDGQRSSFVSARRPMRPPSNLAATEGTRTDGVRLSWQPSTGTSRSRIYRRARIDESLFDRQYESSWGSAIGETVNSYWLDSTAVPGVDYAYAVSCVSVEGEASALPTASLDSSSFVPVVLDGTGSVVSGTQSSSGGSPAFGWRNMVAPVMHSPSRTDSQATQKIEGAGGYGHVSPSVTLYTYTSVFSVSWNSLEGASSYRVDYWPVNDSSQIESETTTGYTFETTVKTTRYSSPDIPVGRTFRVTPIGKHHNGPSSEETVE